MQDLNITLIQSPLHWEDASANRKQFEKKIATVENQTDLIILPEMFTTGFTMNPEEVAESPNGVTHQWMLALAEKTKATILGSLIISDDSKYYNRLLVVNPDGTSHHYDKKHLFAYAGEDEAFSAGKERLIFDLKGWKVCPMVCYDLRFPAWARNSYDANTESAVYDLLLYVANWPKPRVNAWDVLLTARAIENQTYVAGVNRIGLDDNKNEYIGHSAIYDFLGDTVANLGENEGLTTIKLSASAQDAFRKKLPFLQDGDKFSIL